MAVNYHINESILEKFPCAQSLISQIKTLNILKEAVVYHNFPLYIDNENVAQRSDVLVVSKNHGILLFKTIHITTRDQDIINELKDEVSSFEQIFSLIFSKLIKSKILKKSPSTLKIEIIPSLYLFSSSDNGNSLSKEILSIKWDELNFLTSEHQLKSSFEDNVLEEELEDDIYDEIIAILEGSKGLIRPKNRIVDNDKGKTKGKLLNHLEMHIARFDLEQKRAALQILDDAQRIRGLAGSGKTIILAMKVAQIHLTQPDAHILYTYWTKSLHGFVKQLITRFYRQFADKDPDWEKIHIMHGWGGQHLEGVYYNACKDNNVKPINFTEASSQYGRHQAFEYICSQLYENDITKKYDYSIIDEAQDFPMWFYRLLLKLTKNYKIIWGYDECQNILEMNLQDPVTTFGTSDGKKPIIDLKKFGQDIVLHKCYRSYKPVLVGAFALGLGIYNDKIIQMPENSDMWEDLGFEIEQGGYTQGDRMVISRPDNNSLIVSDEEIDPKESLQCKSFPDRIEECNYIISEIVKNITEEELLPQDILVICLNDRYTKEYFRMIENGLNAKNIKTFNVHSSSTYNISFKIPDYVTLSTIYSAKGNESGIVYIVGIDKVFEYKNNITERNKLFTAITRSKMWVKITGIGDNVDLLSKEIKQIFDNNLKLMFVMPDLKELKTFQRGLQKEQEAYNRLLREVDKISEQTGVEPQKLLDLWREKHANNR